MREHFIADIVRKHDLGMGAELGVRHGRTFLHLLRVCPWLTLIGVDLWKKMPEMEAVEGGETYENWNMEEFERIVRDGAEPYKDRAIILKMDTHDASSHVEDGELDFVFIDADHTYEGVNRDITDWTPKVRKGGFIIGHDYNWTTVRAAIYEHFACVETGPDNVWYLRLPA